MKTKETGCELEKKTELLRDALNYLFNYLYAWVPQVSESLQHAGDDF